MAIVVYRNYELYNKYEDYIEDYSFSVVASDTGAEYVFKRDAKPISGLDSSRIDENVRRLYKKPEKPETAQEWADVARYNTGGMQYLLDQKYKTVEEAVAAEQDFAEEAAEMRKDMDSIE
jgi:hypothetical protein